MFVIIRTASIKALILFGFLLFVIMMVLYLMIFGSYRRYSYLTGRCWECSSRVRSLCMKQTENNMMADMRDSSNTQYCAERRTYVMSLYFIKFCIYTNCREISNGVPTLTQPFKWRKPNKNLLLYINIQFHSYNMDGWKVFLIHKHTEYSISAQPY